MASDLNRVCIIGRLVRDVECKTTNNGGMIGKFSLASNRSEKRGNEWQDVAGFFNVVVFGKQAEVLQKHTRKGSRLCVEGHLRFNTWEGNDGKKHSTVEIGLDSFQFLDAKQSDSKPESAAFDSGAMAADETDIPF